MSWADHYVTKLQAGETVQFRPRGFSMRGRVENLDLCTVSPIKATVLEGDVVLCRVKGRQYLHLVKAVKGDRYLIGNNLGHDNGWIGLPQIYGLLTARER